MEQVDAHVELDDMEATSIPHVGDQPNEDILQPTTDQQLTEITAETQLADPTT